MKKSESIMWGKVRPVLLAAKLDPVRVENPIHPGTPDVNLCDGRWIELKCIPAWPKRDTTKVRIAHYTPQQRVWLYRRWKSSPGSTLLLLEVRSVKQWLLFDGDVAAKIVGREPAVRHRTSARAVFVERELDSLAMILAEIGRPSLIPEPVCTGSVVHDEFTHCPVHDVEAVGR